jgi:peroxiredoxin
MAVPGEPHDPTVLPANLPEPRDDGGARHLAGAGVPSIGLRATDGSIVNLAQLAGRTVVFIYPRTGVPGQSLPPGWDQIPGARGCTPQTCSFRDRFSEFKALGVGQVFGLSTQDTDYQREAALRLHLPFRLLSDADLELTRALGLPTFAAAGMTLLKRMTLVL